MTPRKFHLFDFNGSLLPVTAGDKNPALGRVDCFLCPSFRHQDVVAMVDTASLDTDGFRVQLANRLVPHLAPRLAWHRLGWFPWKPWWKPSILRTPCLTPWQRIPSILYTCCYSLRSTSVRTPAFCGHLGVHYRVKLGAQFSPFPVMPSLHLEKSRFHPD